MRQHNLFGEETSDAGKSYSKKIESPIYEPKKPKPHIRSIYDDRKYKRIIRRIESSNLMEDEKDFLKIAATRHIVFNYETAADYYAQASKEMQTLMEDSALVIIDFGKAIELGYIKLCDSIKSQFLTEYPEKHEG